MQNSVKKYYLLFLAVLFTGLFYGRTLQNGFIHDDHGQIETNTYVHSLMYLPKVLTGCIWESAVGNCKETYYYRPLQTLSYMLTHQFSSQPWIFHLVNCLYFAVVAWLVYELMLLLTPNTILAVVTSCIFLVHPLNTEVVNWPAAVPELLYTIFILASTIQYVKFRKKNSKQGAFRICLLYALAIFSKEPAVFLPFVFIALDVLYSKTKIRAKIYLYCFLIFAAYMMLRFSVLGGLGSDPTTHQSFISHIYIFIDLFGKYALKVLWPYPLNLFYTYQPTSNIFVGLILFCLYAGFLATAWIRRWKVVAFALVWYGVFLAPSLLFTSSIGENLFAERHVFASTIGFSILAALVLIRLWKIEKWGRYAVVAILAGYASVSFFLIQARNTAWNSDETLYRDTLTKSPDADLIRYNLAYLYEQAGQTEKATYEYGIIIKRNVWRGVSKAYNNLGNIYRKAGDMKSAEENFANAIAVDPLHVESFNNLGAMSIEQGDYLKSIAYLCKANQINPSFKNANDNLDHVSALIQAMDPTAFSSLFSKITTGVGMQEKRRDCASTDACLVAFTPASTGNYPLSFLIAGRTQNGEIVRPRRVGTQQKTGELFLDIDKKWEKENLQFMFPTCDSVFGSTVGLH